MLVPSMNIEEIRREIERDYPVLFRKVTEAACNVVPLRNMMVSDLYNYYSPQKNKWVYNISRNNNKLQFQFFTYFIGRNGLTGINKIHQSDYLLYLTPHLFHRYNERQKLGMKKQIDVFKTYLGSNSHYIFYQRAVVAPGIKKIFCLCDTGIILGLQDDNQKVYYLKTFIPYILLGQKKRSVVGKIICKALKVYSDVLQQKYLIEAFKKVA